MNNKKSKIKNPNLYVTKNSEVLKNGYNVIKKIKKQTRIKKHTQLQKQIVYPTVFPVLEQSEIYHQGHVLVSLHVYVLIRANISSHYQLFCVHIPLSSPVSPPVFLLNVFF